MYSVIFSCSKKGEQIWVDQLHYFCVLLLIERIKLKYCCVMEIYLILVGELLILYLVELDFGGG